jgi:hypothetical protein
VNKNGEEKENTYAASSIADGTTTAYSIVTCFRANPVWTTASNSNFYSTNPTYRREEMRIAYKEGVGK